MTKTVSNDDLNKLAKLFSTKLEPALETYNADLKENGLLFKNRLERCLQPGRNKQHMPQLDSVFDTMGNV